MLKYSSESKRGICLQTVKTRKADWIGHKHVIEGKIEGKVAGRRERRRNQLLDESGKERIL
jgi:hypothetical protein